MKRREELGGENPQALSRTQSKKLMEQLEGELCELQERNAELEHLSQTEDNLHFLQVCAGAKPQHTSQQIHYL